MSKVLSILLSGACLAFSSLSHSATTLVSFDDVYLGTFSGAGYMGNGYNGLNWTDVAAMDPFAFRRGWQDSGAANGIVSFSNVAFSTSTAPVRFYTETPFTFNSASFAGVWNDGLTLTVTGRRGGVNVYTTSFTVDTSGPALKTFDWTDLNMVTISASGGTRHAGLGGDGAYFGGSGPLFAFDDMTINGPVAAVPEATTVTMMLAGLSILGVAGLRRKKA